MYKPLPIGLNKDYKLNLDVCIFSVKQPKDCNEKEINDFFELIVTGKKLPKGGLKDRIKNCELLAFCYILNNLVAVSAIKRPAEPYIKTIISRTTIDRHWKELPYELGFSVTEDDYKRNGLGKTLKSLLLEEMKSREGIIFGVTANRSTQSLLREFGFVTKGITYDGHMILILGIMKLI